MRRWVLRLLGVGVVGATALAGTMPAYADAAVWEPKGNGSSSIVDAYTVRLEGTNTSVETANLGIEIPASAPGTYVTFEYTLHGGAQCTGGAPRVFLVIDGENRNSWDTLYPNGTQCGVNGVVLFKAGKSGTISAAGVVYDNGGTGYVLVKNLTIGEHKIKFRTEQPALQQCESYETPSGGDLCEYTETDGDLDCGDLDPADRPVKVLDAPKVDPYDLDADGDGIGCEVESTKPSTPTTSAQPPAGGGLPVTGAPVAGLAVGGVLLLGAGAGLLLWRRRVRFTS